MRARQRRRSSRLPAAPRLDEATVGQRSLAAAPPQATAQSRAMIGSVSGVATATEREMGAPTAMRRDSVASVICEPRIEPSDGTEVVLTESLPNVAADAVVATVTGASNPRLSPTDSADAAGSEAHLRSMKAAARPVNAISVDEQARAGDDAAWGLLPWRNSWRSSGNSRTKKRSVLPNGLDREFARSPRASRGCEDGKRGQPVRFNAERSEASSV